jgi:hypothetical protein
MDLTTLINKKERLIGSIVDMYYLVSLLKKGKVKSNTRGCFVNV